MAGNTLGTQFRITTFGESHGAAIGVVIDGCPPRLAIDVAFIQRELDRRRPGQSDIVTQRQESDTVQVLSGVWHGQSTGAPIALLIANHDARSADYTHVAQSYRPSHADFTYQQKYGIRDARGGGRSSARETAARVAAGAVAKLLLREVGVRLQSYVSQIGHLSVETPYTALDLTKVETTPVRCPDLAVAEAMQRYLLDLKAQGDTIGGSIQTVVQGCPVGWGEPVFDKLQADLAKAMLSINACKGFEYGSGFAGVRLKGSEHNDSFINTPQGIRTRTNHSGGIQGGISNGMDIYFRCAFKPIATLAQPQSTVSIEGEPMELTVKGRHDPCVVPRAVPIVEAMTALVLADHYLRQRVGTLLPPQSP